MKSLAALLILVLALPTAGCGGLEPAVKPYDRSLLNDPIMDRDRDPISSQHLRRIQECGEGARGGTGHAPVGGACN